MKVIVSKDNPAFRSALKLFRKKYRDETGRFLLEGVKPLKDAVRQGVEIDRVFLCESNSEGNEVFSHGIIGSETVVLDRRLFDQLSDTETSQGVIAVVKKPVCSMPEEGNVVILDRLQDPGNIGTIIRTAEGAGFAAVISVKGTGDIYSPKVVRSAAGSVLRVPVSCGMSTEDAINICKGRQLVVTALEGAEDFRSAMWKGDCALVIGNEGRGVSSEFIEMADMKVKIPMMGEIESLNAAVAAGILMYKAAGKVK